MTTSSTLGTYENPQPAKLMFCREVDGEKTFFSIGDGSSSGAVGQFDTSAAYAKDAIVFAVEDGALAAYASLVDNNSGHALSETDYWQRLSVEGSTLDGSTMYAPELVSPKDSATEVERVTTLIAGICRNAYEQDERTYRQFEIQLAGGDWTAPVLTKLVNSDSYTLSADEILESETAYEWRCRDVTGWGRMSPYSDVGAFTTGDETTVLSPTLTVPDLIGSPTLKASAFTTQTGITDTHTSTDWLITKGGVEVWSSTNDTENLTSITVPMSVFETNSEYVFSVRYLGASGVYSNWASVTASTGDDLGTVYPPTLLTISDPTTAVTASPTLTASDFVVSLGSDVHESTDWVIMDSTGTTEVWSSKADTENLLSITVPRGYLEESTSYIAKVRFKGAVYGYGDYTTLNFTCKDTFVSIAAPTLTVAGAPSTVMGAPLLTASEFTVVSDDSTITDTHELTEWQVVNATTSAIVYEVTSSATDGDDLLSVRVPWGTLTESTAYTFRVRFKGETYGYSDWAEVQATTYSTFGGLIGTAGQAGFGVGIAPVAEDELYTELGLKPLENYTVETSDNYGNYQSDDGSVWVYVPCHAVKIVSDDVSDTHILVIGRDQFGTEAEANALGYSVPKCFINAGEMIDGKFYAKYKASQDSTGKKAVFVKNKDPISLSTNSSYNPISSGMTGCSGYLYDAITLSKAIHSKCQVLTIFDYGMFAMLSLAHGQAATDSTYCAWLDTSGTMNFPKGANNNSSTAPGDTNDSTVTYTKGTTYGYKGKTGSGSPFAKTTHNGQGNGIADLNGLLWEVAIGITQPDTGSVSGTFYMLKDEVDIRDLTYGDDSSNANDTDVWGSKAHLLKLYDEFTFTALNNRWGNSSGASIVQADSGTDRGLMGVWAPSAGSSSSGTNEFGCDYNYQGGSTNNLFLLCCGYWSNGALAGIFYRNVANRTNSHYNYGFRAGLIL